MKRLTIFFCSMFIISCQHQESQTGYETSEKVKNSTATNSQTEIIFHKVSGKGVLIGEDIKLLDKTLKEIKDISFLNEQLVQITEVSLQYHKTKPDDDYCQEFKYVKIKTKDLEGYVDGRKIYELIKHNKNKILKIDNSNVSFTSTRFFGIGVSDDEGLTGCSIRTPVLFRDESANYEGLVKMVKNKYYEDSYPYFELKEDEMAFDEILSIERQKDKYVLAIRREFQEGGATFKVAIYMDQGDGFLAEIIEF